jgi:signal recognition particle receptor subunit beta
MWSIVSENAIGAVVLANNAAPDAIATTVEYVRAFAPRVAAGNCVVGVGRTEDAPLPTVDEYIDALAAAGFEIPVMAIDVRNRAHNLLLLDVLLARLEAERKLAA